MSSKSDTLDIVYASDTSFQTFVKNGWFRPLDDLWAKYRDEFKLDDFPESVRKTYTHDGHLYVMPHTLNTMMFFYRKDLFDAAGKSPPKTIRRNIATWRSRSTARCAPAMSVASSRSTPPSTKRTGISMRSVTAGSTRIGSRSSTTPKGVQAIEMMQEITKYAQQGFTAAANDECMIAYQQDTGVMGLQWATRAKAMDDPTKSRVVGKIDWVAPPQGHARNSSDGYAISAFSKQDPDTLFRIIATSASQASMRGAASLLIPPRKSLLDDRRVEAGEPVLPGRAGLVRDRPRARRRCRNSTRSASSSPAASCRPSPARCR